MIGLGSGNLEADQAHVVSGLVAGVLMICGLSLTKAWDERILGSGVEELKRVYRAFGATAVFLGLVGLALRIESVRHVGVRRDPALRGAVHRRPYGMRKVLHRARRNRRCMLPVLAVGDDTAVTDLIRRTQRDPYFGWNVTGACTPAGTGPGGSPRSMACPSSATSTP